MRELALGSDVLGEIEWKLEHSSMLDNGVPDQTSQTGFCLRAPALLFGS